VSGAGGNGSATYAEIGSGNFECVCHSGTTTWRDSGYIPNNGTSTGGTGACECRVNGSVYSDSDSACVCSSTHRAM